MAHPAVIGQLALQLAGQRRGLLRLGLRGRDGLRLAGVDPTTRAPLWSASEQDAKPIALDGVPGGDPHESVELVGQMTLSWLPEPINKWMMLYGADPVDELVDSPGATLEVRARGSIMVRFADHPWGPFSPPQPHLQAGDPTRAGDLCGPGGVLYSPDCVSTAQAACKPRGRVRPADTLVPGCPPNLLELDPGRLYAPNIIDNYTRPNARGGLDVTWNVSTWDPYSVVMFQSSIDPPEPGGLELADGAGLVHAADWRRLAQLDAPLEHVLHSSRERQSNAAGGANNFVCASADAQIDRTRPGTLHFDSARCAERYVKGVVLGRFEGPGRLLRTWLSMASLAGGPADDEVLRVYVDDDPQPRVDVPLADAISGRAGEIFARPFGAGSTHNLAWYYPVAYRSKLIVVLDKLDPSDTYSYELEAVKDDAVGSAPLPAARLAERDRAFTQLDAVYHPALGALTRLLTQQLALDPGSTRALHVDGPATVQELRVRVAPADLSALAKVDVSVRWDGQPDPAIALPLTQLFAFDQAAPERSSLALTSLAEVDMHELTLKLPMPFASAADLSFENHGSSKITFELALDGDSAAPGGSWGHLHVQRSETRGGATHVAASASGRGRLLGVCHHLEGNLPTGTSPNPAIQLALDQQLLAAGTGLDHYVDDTAGFVEGARANAFVQTWGITHGTLAAGRADFCRWHVLGHELDFSQSLKLSVEPGAGSVSMMRSVAYLYLAD